MKTSYVALSPLAVACVCLAGFLVGSVVEAPLDRFAIPHIGFAVLLLIAVREDAVEPIENGIYTRRWCVWRWRKEAA